MNLLNISGCSLHYVLSDLLFQDIALTAHVAFFDGVVQPFATRFELSQQTLLMMADIHSRVTMSLQYFSFILIINIISMTFFLLIVVKCCFYNAFFIIVYILNKIT
jgi:hypothetical protein